ncbi:beta-N-acetylhexosaminidase [Pedobacter sp. AW1-32]|uniref:beta-N-acetylhexosaminidase n=1 Tax=Pedobacter sp. AW1-32 TaxID=3383026 RepID=UPI003FEF3D3F
MATAQQNTPLIPYPKQMTLGEGVLQLMPNFEIAANQDVLQSQVLYLQQSLFDLKGITPIHGEGEDAAIYLVLLSTGKNKGTEAYKLKITEGQVKIESSSPAGIFNGIQSFLQLVRGSAEKNKIVVPILEIKDEPKFAWRGFMLDESRHFFGVAKVKSILDWMALYKLNRFHWHLTDVPGWRLEIKKYPRLTLVGGIGSFTDPNTPANYYTQQQIKEVVAYAAERFITVIPEIDMPGHATAANKAYPEFSGGGSKEHPDFTFNPGLETTYSYLTKILNETQLLFRAQMIHIGGDEVSFGNDKWRTDTTINTLKMRFNLKNELEVEKYFIKRMADSVFKLKNKVLVWDEMVDAGLPKDKTIIFWWRHDKPQQLNASLKMGYQTVLCPRLPLYFDFVQDSTHRFGRKWDRKFNDLISVYNFNADNYVDGNLSENNILGIQANLWTETAQNSNRLDYLLFPRIAALAEASWLESANKNSQEFLKRLEPHIEWFKASGLNFYNPFNPNETTEPLGKSRLSLNYKD